MPPFSKILNENYKIVPRGQHFMEDIRLQMITLSGDIIHLAQKQKEDKLRAIQVIALVGFHVEEEDPVISNQGSLLLQDDQRINNLDKELIQGLAKYSRSLYHLGIVIVTTTEERGKFVPIQVPRFLQGQYWSFTYINDPKINRMVDKYLDGVDYHPHKYTRKGMFLDHDNTKVVKTMQTRQCFVHFGILRVEPPPQTPKCSLKVLICLFMIAAAIVVYFCFRDDISRILSHFWTLLTGK
uniref:TPM_phosphatase domain-containing protein n=1 Tax=Caenorhabditis tropicalis TaxID=1561998 RepID=A0A1I7TLV4_9PELO